MELGTDGLWLNMSFEPSGSTMADHYQRIIDMPVSSSNEEQAITKLSNLTTNEINGGVYYQGVAKSFVGEPAYTYEAVWLQKGITYRLSMSAMKENVV